MKRTGHRTSQAILTGTSISAGCAAGRAFVYKDILSRNLYHYSISREDVKKELARIQNVFGRVLTDIEKQEKNVKNELGRKQSDIFKVHAAILKDKTLIKDIEKELKNELVNAEHAVRNIFRRWANKCKTAESEALKSKADDFEDLSRRVLCAFMACDINVLEKVPPRSVIVARRLLPSDTVRLKRKNVAAIVVEEGSNVSHSAIIARSLGIPAVTEVAGATGIIAAREKLIVDGYKGRVVRNPDAREMRSFRDRHRTAAANEAALIRAAKRHAATRDGTRVAVYANVASREDATVAARRGYDGIGLLRVEQLYMSAKILPDEKRLIAGLTRTLEPVRSKVVTFRLLDIGADKKLPYMHIEEEPSPALGLRGVRLLLKYRNLLRTQLKAASFLAREHSLRVLVPIVTFHDEMRMVREMAGDCREEIERSCGIRPAALKIGAMIETPAAVENIEKIADISDFLSIGTNDLIQYSVAAGRDNPSVTAYYEQGTRLIMPYIERVVRSAERHGIECSICGEMAGDPAWTRSLYAAGLRALSVSPYLVPLVKSEIRKI